MENFRRETGTHGYRDTATSIFIIRSDAKPK